MLNLKNKSKNAIMKKGDIMEFSTSILTIKDQEQSILAIDKIDTDYIHIDVMDGNFVNNYADFRSIKGIQKPLDIHFMVQDINQYIDAYLGFHPVYMTFHIEACQDDKQVRKYIEKIRNNHIKVGISISPDTDIDKIKPYLNEIDLVLVMSVYPGYGGQTFIETISSKIEKLSQYRKEEGYTYKIEVDGGINPDTCLLCQEADILVIGSYITDSKDPKNRLQTIKQKFI